MKKPLALVLVLGLVVALSACTIPSDGTAKGTTTAPNPSVTTTVASTPTTDGNKSTTTALPVVKETTAYAITRDQAIDIALQAAGLSRADVYDLEAELDRERGGTYWEVDFETREYEYSYDINAETGAIARSERERNYD